MKKLLAGFILLFVSMISPAQNFQNKVSKGQYPTSSVFNNKSLPDFIPGKVVFINDQGTYAFDSGVLINNETDTKSGEIHYRTQQQVGHVKIENAVYVQHVINNKVVSANGKWLKNLPARLLRKATISEKSALRKALQQVGASVYKWQVVAEELLLQHELNNTQVSYYPKGILVYYSGENDVDSSRLRLAYKFDIYAHVPLSRQFIFIDAANEKVLGARNLIHRSDVMATANTVYSGVQTITTDGSEGSYRLREAGRGRGIETYNLLRSENYPAAVDFTNPTTVWNNINENKDQYATDAHWATEKTWDYFYYNFGRKSIDNAGFPLRSYVHFSNNYYNAFWDGFRLTYGDGNSVNNYQPLTTLDVCGHEIAHGLTMYTSSLVYSGESGALNEGFSDIIGTAVENYARPGKWDWIIGGDFGGLRNMSNPNAYMQPDTYKGKFWDPAEEVHTNSGVINFWFYLLSEGGSGINDLYCKYNVKGIGFEKAALIAYKTNTQYLFPTAKYEDAAKLSLMAAADLFGSSSNEVAQTASAWSAVGLNIPPTTPEIAASSSIVCAGNRSSLSIVGGNLNGAAYWKWYRGTCGGDVIGTGNSIDVWPDSTTTYYVRGEGGCIDFGACTSVTITVSPDIARPLINVTGSVILCQGQTVTLSGTPGFSSYYWSDGSTTQKIIVDKSGSYQLRVAGESGCVSPPSDAAVVTVTAPAMIPKITVTGSTTSCVSGSVKLTSTPAFSYLWSNGEKTPSIIVNKPGNYSITITTEEGCSATSLSQPVQFTDKQPPIPSLATLPTIKGECEVSVTTIPTAMDSCVGSVRATTTDPLNYNSQGDHIINWIYKDDNGNFSTQQQHVVIKDVTPPQIFCPVFSGGCSSSGIYQVPLATATDNCAVDNSGFTYSVSGATNRSGKGKDASGYFATGINTITFSARDINGNINTCSSLININPGITAAIPEVYSVSPGGNANTLYIGYGPTSLQLSVNVSGGSGIYSYKWSTGATTKLLVVTLFTPGSYTYRVKVTDSKGCSVETSVIVYVVDVTCGNNNDKISICKVPPGNPDKRKTNCVASKSVEAQLSKDSYLGSCSLVSDPSALAVINQNNVSNNDKDFHASVWPNPSYTNFKIKITSNSNLPVTFQISDVLGRTLLSKSNYITGNLYEVGGDFIPGIYYIQAIQGVNRISMKVVKLSF